MIHATYTNKTLSAAYATLDELRRAGTGPVHPLGAEAAGDPPDAQRAAPRKL